MDDWTSFANRIVMRDDIRRFSQDFIPVEHRRLLTMANSCRENAARGARLKRGKAKLQTTGDGEMSCWPAGTNVLDLLNVYLPLLHRELQTLNRAFTQDKQLRMRLAITEASCVMEGGVLTGDAPIAATRLVESKACRDALERFPSSPLAVVIDDGIYRNAVKGGQSLYPPERFVPAEIEIHEKGFVARAWIIVFGDHDPPPRPEPEPSPRPDWKVAGVAAGGLAAVLGSVLFLVHDNGRSDPQPTAGPSRNQSQSPVQTPSDSPATAGPTSPGPSALPTATGRVWREQADNHNGSALYTDVSGTQADGGAHIPYGDWVDVSCYAPNGTGMSSINYLYLIADGKYAGLYTPANTFANGDPFGVPGGSHDIDPNVPPCAQQ